MQGWNLTKRGDYINGNLAGRTRAGIVALERSGLWSFVLRTLAGVEKGRGANYPTAAAAPAMPNRTLAAEVLSFMRKNGGAG